jgi:hypothetical protein
MTSDVVSSAGGVPEGAEIVGASPALVETTGKTVAESESDTEESDTEESDTEESDTEESDIEESDIEVTPRKMAPTIVKTRAMAITVRNKIFIGASLPFSF